MGNHCVGQSDTPDDTTHLSGKDIRRIRRNWRQIHSKKLAIPTGAELFVTLFETYPYMMSYFETFGLRDTPGHSNKRLIKHALTFIRGIDLYVDYIDAPEVLIGLMQRVSLNHLERRITSEDMERMAETFVLTLRSQLGDDLTEQCEEAWEKLFYFINAVYRAVELQVQDIYEVRRSLWLTTTGRALGSQSNIFSETSIE